jgi:hypothetical protein
MAGKILHHFFWMVPHMSADHFVHCLPYFPPPNISLKSKSFFIESDPCIICPKYSNLLIHLSVTNTIAVNTVSRFLMTDSKSVWNMTSCISEYGWQVVNLFRFYIMNISQWTVLRMSNSNMSQNSHKSQQYTDFKICPIIIILFSVVCE